MADEVTRPRPVGEENVQDIQITLHSESNPISVRELKVKLKVFHNSSVVSLKSSITHSMVSFSDRGCF